MHYIIIVALLAASALAEQRFSINLQVGTRSGTPFVLQGHERITAVRTWDSGNYIYAIQLRVGDIWGERAGVSIGNMQEFEMFDGEAITQVSGKWSSYIQSLVFVTNKGRLFFAGQPSGRCFNMYAQDMGAELLSISGTFTSRGLTGFAAHFGASS